ncbi:TetR family transcriptional regulator [Hamadaea sp. NPDC051192]|uniref:TetR family transcriptional regulator n=1 Tax=Hamadaea sp. NPDC051192 TaxID=3154940 RepID=UPI00341A350B
MAAPISTDSTSDRIVAAATAEFSEHGIAGARVERIAKAAKTSKERVYAHFQSKEALYRFVAARELAAVAEATRMDPADLPGYAGRVHDYFLQHPARRRLMTWGQMELSLDGQTSGDPLRESVRHKVEQLRQAQEAGQLHTGWDPMDVLMFVNQLAMSWAGNPALVTVPEGDRDAFLADRRAAIVAAVQRLFPAHRP